MLNTMKMIAMLFLVHSAAHDFDFCSPGTQAADSRSSLQSTKATLWRKALLGLLEMAVGAGDVKTWLRWRSAALLCARAGNPARACSRVADQPVSRASTWRGRQPGCGAAKRKIRRALKREKDPDKVKELLDQLQPRNDASHIDTAQGVADAVFWRHALMMLEEVHAIDATPSVGIYNSVIQACEKGAEWQCALSMLDEMLASGAEPTWLTYNTVISTCERCGQWDQAMRIATSMQDVQSLAGAANKEHVDPSTITSATGTTGDQMKHASMQSKEKVAQHRFDGRQDISDELEKESAQGTKNDVDVALSHSMPQMANPWREKEAQSECNGVSASALAKAEAAPDAIQDSTDRGQFSNIAGTKVESNVSSPAPAKRIGTTSTHNHTLHAVEPVEWHLWPKNNKKTFMKEIWQRKPLLVRGAFPDLLDKPLILPEDVMRMGGPSNDEYLEKQESRGEPSSAVVHGCEKTVPEISEFLTNFKCIPTWRFSDVMVSCADSGAGLAAHADSHGVILVQGSGKGEWSISTEFAPLGQESANLAPNSDVRVIENFSATHTWVLEPGDMLYLPPGIPRRGVSKGKDCTTLSIGFELPHEQEVVTQFSKFAASYLDQDKVMEACASDALGGSEIHADAMAAAKEVIFQSLMNVLLDDNKFSEWYGNFVTRPPHGSPSPSPENRKWMNSEECDKQFAWLLEALKKCPRFKLVHAAGVKFAHVFYDKEDPESGNAGLIFVDGESFPFPSALKQDIPRLTARGTALPSDFVLNAEPAMLNLLRTLVGLRVFELEF